MKIAALAKNSDRFSRYAKGAKVRAARHLKTVAKLRRRLPAEGALYLQGIVFLLKVQRHCGVSSKAKAVFMAVEQRWILDVTRLSLEQIPNNSKLRSTMIKALKAMSNCHGSFLKKSCR